MQKYDVIIVGAGPSGIFCAYELVNKNLEREDKLKILLLEKGNSIDKRVCPKRTTGKCVNCDLCSITTGFAGAGAFSDGKLTLASSETGGNLSELIGEEKTKELISRMDEVYLKFGADTKLHGVGKEKEIAEIRKKAIKANMKLIESPIRHLGTESSYHIYGLLQQYLIDNGVDIKFRTMVDDIIVDNKDERPVISGVVTKDETYYAPIVVVGAGREGSTWFKSICEKHNINTTPGVVDIGVRVECRDEIMKELNDTMYESKLVYYTKTYNDKVRTFCQNPSGEVALENYNFPSFSQKLTKFS